MTEMDKLVYEVSLDAPVDKVWRALTIPEYRDRWLQPPLGAEFELLNATAGSRVTYRLMDQDEESLVTVELSPREEGGTFFRLTHAPLEISAANNNEATPATVMLAA